MKLPIAALAVAAFSLTTPAAAERPSGEEKLAKLLDGRVAGEPTGCVNTRPGARLYIIDDTALVYDAGRTIYVNYTQDPEALDGNDLIVTRNTFAKLCRSTQIETRDRYSPGFTNGALFLTDFVPYHRPEDEG